MLCVQVRAESLYVNVFLVSDSFLQPPVLWCSSDGTFSILIHSRCEFVGSSFFISDCEHIPYIYTMGDAQDLSRAAFPHAFFISSHVRCCKSVLHILFEGTLCVNLVPI